MRTPRVRACLDVCASCESAVIVALDAAVAGIPVRADPITLDGPSELRARLEGRMTYNLVGHPVNGRFLVERIPELVRHRRHPVVAAHRCPGPVPVTAIPPPTDIRSAGSGACSSGDIPPF
ncbi:hypothetical protein [Nocardiopsis sp. FIRDI 009]|uniref:hypothetical protein n=1 Tax=Nocardiopsis sp. FIRDI 009 TaxID=714197 RepID=UPI000E24DFB8|nr:hypothetical protein [Nocardiopsis sp. FIRDI 009]